MLFRIMFPTLLLVDRCSPSFGPRGASKEDLFYYDTGEWSEPVLEAVVVGDQQDG